MNVENDGVDFGYFNVSSNVVCFKKYFLLEIMNFTFKQKLFINVYLFKLVSHIEIIS